MKREIGYTLVSNMHFGPGEVRKNVGFDGRVAILIFILSLILLVAAAASGYQSIDLLPTGIGVLYALAGTVAACAAVVTFTIGVLVGRIDGLAKLVAQSAALSVLRRPLSVAPSTETAAGEHFSGAPFGVEQARLRA